MNTVIQCSRITKSYSADFFCRKKRAALRDVSFDVTRGEVLGIIGPNGAGKSTTLKILMGFVKQDSGTAYVNGLPVHQAACRNHIGFLPENPTLYSNLTIVDHLKFACRVSRADFDHSKTISKLLALVDLTEAADKPIRQYSKGMVQRAALAYALLSDPEILILDEPMSGLDPLGRELVTKIINQYNAKGTTILFSSHILGDVERVCDRIAIMDKGQLLDVITPEQLQDLYTDKTKLGNKTALEYHFFKKIRDSLA